MCSTTAACTGSRRTRLASRGRSGAPFGLAPSSPALGHQGPLVLGHGGADLSKQLIMRIITHGPLDKLDATASLGEFVDQEHLMHIVTREAIGRSHQHACKGGHRRPISESIKTGALAGGATLAVITGDVLVGHLPIGARRHVIAETTALLFNRRVLLLTTGRDTHGESHFHGIPPDDAMAQGCCLRCVP